MKNFLSAIFKYLLHYPNAKLWIMYRMESNASDGDMAITYACNKKTAQRFKNDEQIRISKRLMCKTF